mmetsp:Transcript_6610/g.15024  ORF Transcript_6610/g.15024 Transcript_6610/m.15024 type:complete len:93 (+) Transcript_6610:842-1120(+)
MRYIGLIHCTSLSLFWGKARMPPNVPGGRWLEKSRAVQKDVRGNTIHANNFYIQFFLSVSKDLYNTFAFSSVDVFTSVQTISLGALSKEMGG